MSLEEITRAITQTNVWDLKKIFKNLSPLNKQRYLNEFWIDEGIYLGSTLLHISVSFGIDVCKILLENGANPNQLFDLSDNTPLHIACIQNKDIIIRLLIKYGADTSIQNINKKTCYQLCENKLLIDKCIQEQDILKKQLQNIPIEFTNDNELKKIVSTFNDETIIDDVLLIILQKLENKINFNSNDDNINDSDESDNNNNDRNESIENMVNKWSTQFSNISITLFEQLMLHAFEDWPILIDLPPIIIYCLEQMIDVSPEILANEISNFTPDTPIIDILNFVNIKLKHKFDDKLKEIELIFKEQECSTLSNLQNIKSDKWKNINIKIDLGLFNYIRKIINLYNLNDNSNVTEIESNDDTQDKDKYILLSLSNTISCITIDSKFIHIATVDGVITAYDLKTNDAFHTFQLKITNPENNKQSIYVPECMQFLNNKHEQLVTVNKNGFVSCWYLHSLKPNKRAKCIRNWKNHNGYISGFAVQSELIYTIGIDGQLIVRDLGYNGQIIHEMQYSESLTVMAFISKTCILIGTENGNIMQVDIRKEKIVNTFKLDDPVAIRSLCIDKDTNNVYFSFGAHSIGLLNINDEWNFLGKFTEGFDHHSDAINHLVLRNEYLFSCSEDNTIRIWDLKFLKENLENGGKKKGKNVNLMPKSLKLADSQTLENDDSSTQINLLEAWCTLEIKGMHNNGIQKLYFSENKAMMVPFAYQKNIIVYNLDKIDNELPKQQEIISNRRKELNDYEKRLNDMNNPKAPDDAKTNKKGKKK